MSGRRRRGGGGSRDRDAGRRSGRAGPASRNSPSDSGPAPGRRPGSAGSQGRPPWEEDEPAGGQAPWDDDTGGFQSGPLGDGWFDTGAFDRSETDRGGPDTGRSRGFGPAGPDTGGFDTGGFDTEGFDTGGFGGGGPDTGRSRGFGPTGPDAGGFDGGDADTGPSRRFGPAGLDADGFSPLTDPSAGSRSAGRRAGRPGGVPPQEDLAWGHPSGPLPPLPPQDDRPGARRSPPSSAGAPGDSWQGPPSRRDAWQPGISPQSGPGGADDLLGRRSAGDDYPTGPGFGPDAGERGQRPAALDPDGPYHGYPGGFLDEDDDYSARSRRGAGRDGPGYRRGGRGYADYAEDEDGFDGRYGPDPEEGWYYDEGDGRAWGEEEDADDFVPGLDPRRGPGGRGPRGDGRGPRGDGRGRKGKRKRGIRRAAPWIALAAVLLLVVGVGGGGFYYYYTTRLHPPDYSGVGTGAVTVHVVTGDSALAIGQMLQRDGVVKSARAFANAAKASAKAASIDPGYYRLRKRMKASLALALLLKPSSVVQTKVTIREGERMSQIIQQLGKATHNVAGYQKAIKDVSALGLPSFAHGNPEGYLFPATYKIPPHTPPIKVLQEMVTRFDQEAAKVQLPVAAAHGFLTESGAITVASLVQAEGGKIADYPKIARVIYNRLNNNMRLQLDSTVMYAAHTYGVVASSSQLKIKSPYNTYLHLGLPPGPIDSPGDKAIQAALHPAKGNWLYFVTVDPTTGETKFTSSQAVFAQLRQQLNTFCAQHKTAC